MQVICRKQESQGLTVTGIKQLIREFDPGSG